MFSVIAIGKSALISLVILGSSDITASPACCDIDLALHRPTAHRHHKVTRASISLASSQRNQPLDRPNDPRALLFALRRDYIRISAAYPLLGDRWSCSGAYFES